MKETTNFKEYLMFKSKYMKITVPAAVIAAFIAFPLSLNVYASSSKQFVPLIYSVKSNPDKAFSASAEVIFYPDVNYLVWLKEQKSYNIVGEERFIGQNATIITGKLGEPLAKKSQLTEFKMWADPETGQILNIAIYNGTGVPRGLKAAVPHPPKPQPQPDDEMLLSDANGDFEIDKQVVESSAYEVRINGMSTQVVSGHFRVFDSDGTGKSTDDKQDGVIAVWIIGSGKFDYKFYHSPEKHGALKILSVKDKNIFSIVAADGTKFTFDLKNRTLSQVQ
jgi:hypothetical protein